MRKCKLITFVVLCIILLSTVVQASAIGIVNSNNTKYVLNSNFKFTKKIVNYNEETQEIEIELCIKNIKENKKDIEDIEIAIVLDNSGSMSERENSTTKKETTYNAAYKFIGLLYDNIKKLEVGVTQYSNNSSVITRLTDSKELALNALNVYKATQCSGGTNTHTALEMAKAQFDGNCKNRVVVLVTDGYPNSPNETKQQLEKLEAEGIYTLSLIVSKADNIQSIQEIFGTEEAPTAGGVYYISNSVEIDKMFNEYMYNQILNYMEHPITDVKIEDVFPEELLKYFDIEYMNIPKDTTVSEIGDNNSFTWSIDEVEAGETITFRYKVKIKKGVNINEVISKELKTNEKVIINYEDEKGKKKEEIFNDNPVIKVEPEIINVITNIDEDDINDTDKYVIVDITPKDDDKPNNTPTKVVSKPNSSKPMLPQTGIEDLPITILIGSILVSIGFGIRWIVIERIAKGK